MTSLPMFCFVVEVNSLSCFLNYFLKYSWKKASRTNIFSNNNIILFKPQMFNLTMRIGSRRLFKKCANWNVESCVSACVLINYKFIIILPLILTTSDPISSLI